MADLAAGGHLENASVVRALAAVVESLQQGTEVPPVLVGYSLGGRVALQLVASRPGLFSRVAVISASPGLRGACENATSALHTVYQVQSAVNTNRE